MKRKLVLISLVLLFALITTLGYARGPFQIVLRDAKNHTNEAVVKTRDIASLAQDIHAMTLDIQSLARVINFEGQQDTIRIFKDKAWQLHRRIAALESRTDNLKALTKKLQDETRMMDDQVHALPPGPRPGDCPPGMVWVPAHRIHTGELVPGHCAR